MNINLAYSTVATVLPSRDADPQGARVEVFKNFAGTECVRERVHTSPFCMIRSSKRRTWAGELGLEGARAKRAQPRSVLLRRKRAASEAGSERSGQRAKRARRRHNILRRKQTRSASSTKE
jgi:hypothetical protein